MPLLPQEPCVYPESLLSIPAGGDDIRWWVLHTKPRAEKSLARRLRGKQIAFFLPLYHRQWRSSGRLRDAFLPLFPGYLFLFGDAEARRRALETNLILRTLQVNDQRRFEQDLKRVQQMIEHGSGLTPEDRLRPGTRVEIISGPLTGMVGTILRRRNRMRFYVEVQLLQQGVSAEIESWMFRPLGSARAAAV